MSLRDSILTYIINNPNCTDEDLQTALPGQLDSSIRAARNGLVKLKLVESTGKRLGIKTWARAKESPANEETIDLPVLVNNDGSENRETMAAAAQEAVLPLPELDKLVDGKLYNVNGVVCRAIKAAGGKRDPRIEGKRAAMVVTGYGVGGFDVKHGDSNRMYLVCREQHPVY